VSRNLYDRLRRANSASVVSRRERAHLDLRLRFRVPGEAALLDLRAWRGQSAAVVLRYGVSVFYVISGLKGGMDIHRLQMRVALRGSRPFSAGREIALAVIAGIIVWELAILLGKIPA